MELYNEDLLYKLFGVNAELLIDHAWGYEPCTMEMVAYKTGNEYVCSLLHCLMILKVKSRRNEQMVLDFRIRSL